ncbi:MAG TPA: hypothetical protein DCG12_16055 [Planctomycetaceae bacterium]|nr:hypothetical protein [Planctomycetaceae bacterium]
MRYLGLFILFSVLTLTLESQLTAVPILADADESERLLRARLVRQAAVSFQKTMDQLEFSTYSTALHRIRFVQQTLVRTVNPDSGQEGCVASRIQFLDELLREAWQHGTNSPLTDLDLRRIRETRTELLEIHSQIINSR